LADGATITPRRPAHPVRASRGPDQARDRRTPDLGPEGPRAWGPVHLPRGVTGSPIRWAGPILDEVMPSAAASVDLDGGLRGSGRPNQPGSEHRSRPSSLWRIGPARPLAAPSTFGSQPSRPSQGARTSAEAAGEPPEPGIGADQCPGERCCRGRGPQPDGSPVGWGGAAPDSDRPSALPRPRLPGSRASPALPEAAARRWRRPPWLPRPADRG